MASRLAPYEQPTPIAMVQIAIATLLGVALCAVVYLVARRAMLPPADRATLDPFVSFLLDPSAIAVVGFVSICCAVPVYPFAALALRGRKLWPSFWMVTGTTISVIVLAMMVVPRQSWLIGFVAVFPILFASRAIPQLAARTGVR